MYWPAFWVLGLPKSLCDLIGARHGAVVGRVRRGLVHLVGVGDDRGDREPGHRGQVAAQSGLLAQTVEGEALADQHEVLLAGLGHHRADVGDRRVVVVTDDLASVDAALGVAPGDHCLDGVAHLLVEAGETGEAPVVAVGDVDGGIGHALVGGSPWRFPCRRARGACRTWSRSSMPPHRWRARPPRPWRSGS